MRFALLLISFYAVEAQDWRSYGGDPGGTRHSNLKQINRKNVSRLNTAWVYHTGEKTAVTEGGHRRVIPFESTPLVVDGVLYFSTPSSRVIALEPETGRRIWIFDPQINRDGPRRLFQHRGVAYWRNDSGSDRRILYGTYDGRLIALDARTGRPRPDFGNDGTINLRVDAAGKWPDAEYAVTSPPAIYRNLVIAGAAVPEFPSHGPSGMVRAYDVRTGKIAWTFHTVPQPGEAGNETWEKDSWRDRTGANVWSMMSVDTERGMVFLPVGSPSYDFYGADRKGQDLFGNSLVALDASSGKLIWHYQFVHHDVWDYDPPAQPLLASVRRDGKEIPAVVQLTKMGLVFVLDRLTGKPLFPVEERPVPGSNVPGEAAWPTQPFPVKPPPLSRQSLSAGEISTVTAESHRFCLDLFRSAVNHGPYTPYGLETTLVFPGTLGGATWSGGSFDRATGYLFVNVNELGSIGMMKPQTEGSPERYRRYHANGEYARFVDDNGWPCQQPPWGTLNAIDLNRGEIVWKVPLGTVDALAAKGLPHTGRPNIGGSIVTAGGLIFIAGTADQRFRAFDTRTGAELWTVKLEASGHATPVTYLGRDGRQYVVIAAGGGGFFSGPVSDTLVAFALP